MPVLLPGAGPCVVAKAVAERLEMIGAEFAYLHDRYGQIMTVPVNH